MSDGNEAQLQAIADKVALNAITRFAQMHPEFAKPEIPAPLKWAGAIMAALFATGVGGTAVWVVSSVNTMQVTLARMDERQVMQGPMDEKRFADVENRLLVLEQKERGGKP